MKPSAWVITAVLVVLALLADWFFGLDERHAVILVGAAVAAGLANGLLEAVELPRFALPAVPEAARGLAVIQHLEFSLASGEPGTRAVREVHAVALIIAGTFPGRPRSAALESFLVQPPPSALGQGEIRRIIEELEGLATPATSVDHPRQEIP